ncbi:MAG: endonuclease/exonuclease/phosphatase family protein [Proteobacteria bacterium]|nr:endonuclease/exonuclease/phosphatase family protein [Pseudomonadota bacterium]
MKLLQWNIQWCCGMDGKVDPARIARVAREIADPDVICFQEVAVNYPALAGSSGEDQVALLRREFPGYTAVFGVGVEAPDDSGGRRQFGNLLLSRLPVRQAFRHTLPWPAEAGTPSMPRIAVEAVVEARFGLVRVITTHLEYYSARQRLAQVERLRELHREACGHARAKPSAEYDSGPFQPFERPRRALVTGDFNMKTDDPAYARMLAPFEGSEPRFVDAWAHANPGKRHPPTFCVFGKEYAKEPYCCDFVFATEDLAPRLRSVRVDVDTQASDHQPVMVELG